MQLTLAFLEPPPQRARQDQGRHRGDEANHVGALRDLGGSGRWPGWIPSDLAMTWSGAERPLTGLRRMWRRTGCDQAVKRRRP